MTPLIVIRPEPGCAETVAAARAMDLAAQGFPLFAVCTLAWTEPGPASFDALLIGSANALRHGGGGLDRYKALPVYAVGATTAAAARQAGFAVAVTGEGGLQALLPQLAADGCPRVLRLSGEAHVPLDPPPGVTVETAVVYAARPLPLPAAAVPPGGCVVALHSGEAARHFAAECARLGLDRAMIALACLAPRVAEAAGAGLRGGGWTEVRVAPTDEVALLALARDMCQNTGLRDHG